MAHINAIPTLFLLMTSNSLSRNQSLLDEPFDMEDTFDSKHHPTNLNQLRYANSKIYISSKLKAVFLSVI